MKKSNLKIFKKIVVWGVAAIILCVFLLFGLLQTPYVKEKISDWISGFRIQGYSCSLQGLQGLLPIDFGFRKLIIRHDKRELLLIEGFEFSWSPRKLFSWRVEITKIAADKLQVKEIPEKVALDGGKPVESKKQTGLELPEYMPGIAVNGLHFPRIILNKPVIGEHAEFYLKADLEYESMDMIKSDFVAFRTDKPGIDTSCNLEYASGILSMNYYLSGGVGGLLGRYTSSAVKSPLELSLRGKGPLGNWSGNLQIQSGKKEILNSDILLGKSGEKLDLALEGSLSPDKHRIVALQGIEYPLQEDISFSLGLSSTLQGDVDVSEFVISGSEIRISSRGTANTAGDLDIDCSVYLGDLEKIPGIKETGVSGALGCEAELQGNWKSRQLYSGIRLDIGNLKGMPQKVEAVLGEKLDLESSLAWQQGNVLQFEKTRLKSGYVDISSNGQYDLNNSKLDVDWYMKEIDLPDLVPVIEGELRGVVRASGNIKGSLEDFDANTNLQFTGFSLASVQPLSVSIQTDIRGLPGTPSGNLDLDIERNGKHIRGDLAFSWIDQRLGLQEMQMDLPDGHFSARGFWSMDKSLVDFRVNSNMDSLSWVETFWPLDIQGALDLNASLKGKEDNIGLSSKANVRDVAYSGINIRQALLDLELSDLSELEGKFGVNAKKIEIEDNLIQKIKLDASKTGESLNLDLAAQGNYGRNFNLDLSGEYFYARDALRLDKGKGRYAGMDFSWQKPVDIAFISEELFVRGEDIDLAQGEMDLDFSMRPDVLQGGISLTSISLSSLPLPQVQKFEGNLDADFSISGSKASPRMEFSFQVPDLTTAVYIKKLDKAINVSCKGTYAANDLYLELEITESGEQLLAGEFDIPAGLSLSPFYFEPEDGMHGEVSTSLDLEWVTEILGLQKQMITGELVSAVNISGSLYDPLFSGDVKLKNGSYEYADTGTSIQDIKLQCELNKDVLKVTEFSSSAGEGGNLEGQGELQFSGENGLNYSFGLDLDDAQLYNTDLVDGKVSGDLNIQGSGDKTSFSGELKVFPLELGIPEPGPKGLSGLEVVEVGSQGADQDGKNTSSKDEGQENVLSSIFLDLRIKVPGGMYIRGRGVDSEWSGDLRLRGSLDDLGVNGKMQVERGNMNILGKRFTFDKGKVTFTDQSPPKPYFEVLAVHTRSNLKVNLFLSGTPDDFSINITSEPTYPREEILSRLLFGKGVNQITPLQAVKLAWSIRQLTSGSSGIMGNVRNFLQVDMLQIKAAEEGEGATVGVGKYLNEDVYFEVEKGVQGETGRVTVSVELTPRFSMQSVYGSMNQGVTFNWEYQY